MTGSGNRWPRGRILKAAALAMTGIAAFAVVVHLSRVFLPLGLALLLAYILEPVISWLDRHHSRRVFSVSVFYVLFLAVLVVGGIVVVPPLVEQGKNFVSFVQKRAEAYGFTWDEWPGQDEKSGASDAEPKTWWTRLLGSSDTAGDSTNGAPATASAKHGKPETGDAESGDNHAIVAFLRRHLSVIEKKAPAVALEGLNAIVTGAGQVAGFTIQLVLTLFYAFFFMLHFPDIRNAWARWAPRSPHAQADGVVSEMDDVVAGFFRGRLLVCLISAAVASIGLLISGIHFWLLLGVASGFLGIIPYVGVALTLIPAVLIAFSSEHSLFSVVGVLITFGIVQGVVEPFVGPFVISSKVRLHPVTVVVAIMAGGMSFGILGMFLAVPAAGILKILARRYLVPAMHSVVRPHGS